MIGEVSEESEIEDPARVVERFLNALHQEDWGTATTAMDERIVYDNVGYPTINGSHGVMRFWHRIFGRRSAGFEAKIHRIAVDGLSVLTERIDLMVFGPFRLRIWVCGVFEVRSNKITLWRDYFDLLDMVKAAARGLVGIVVPSLRPTL